MKTMSRIKIYIAGDSSNNNNSHMSTMESSMVLPGDTLPDSLLPKSASKALKLGPGLRHLPPSTIKATVAGTVTTDNKKNAVWIEYNGGRVSVSLLTDSDKS
jgi:hypothetical protein